MKFLPHLLLFKLFACSFFLHIMPPVYSKSNQDVIRHVVCFRFIENAHRQEIKRVETEFSSLQDKISGIKSLEWGKNNSPEGLNKEFTHCFIVTFTDTKAREQYLPHPDHQKFVSILKPILEDVFVIDFTPSL